MIRIPFSRNNFSEEAKCRLSGINTTLEFDNIESGLLKAAFNVVETLGLETYNSIVSEYNVSSTNQDKKTALDYLQRAILHFALHEQLIYLIIRIGNDGITTKKNNDETTIFKYQQDELDNNLINTVWFWMDKLIEFINTKTNTFEEWHLSENKKEIDSLPVTIKDFNRWVGVNNIYFFVKTRWIIREIFMDHVEPRFGTSFPDDKHDKIVRAVVYSVMDLACRRMAYADLPETIRKDIDNEQSKTNKDKAQDRIREIVSRQFSEQAVRYWKDIDLYIQSTRATGQRLNTSTPKINENDKFYFV